MPALSTLERQQAIVTLVSQDGRASVSGLARQFGVSEVTIRSDLVFLTERGMVVRARGGALASAAVARERSHHEKRESCLPLKRRLAQAAATLIGNDQRILLDSGTTTEEVAIALRQHQNLIVMTNGLNVAYELAQAEGIEVLMTGGLLRHKSFSFYGAQAEQQLRHYHFDKAVIGVDGFDLRIGLTTWHEPEAQLNRLMCQNAREIIVVTDSSKFERRGFHVICACADIDVLVTDSGLPTTYHQELLRMGVRLHIVESEDSRSMEHTSTP